MTQSSRPRVVIVGAGFAGLRAAKALRKVAVDITVIDRSNHHLFQPLLYQVASAALDPSDIAYPIRASLRKQKNTRVVLGTVIDVNLTDCTIELEHGASVPFDYLILATGVTHSYFGNDSWKRHAPGLKTVENALEIRRRVLLAFEIAERDPAASAPWLTFVVVGAGPTGVELAGSFAEISRHTLAKDFRAIDPASARVILVEGGPRVLAAYPEGLSAKAEAQLRGLGVDVRCDTQVTGVDGHGVDLKSGERIEARTVFWAAGVEASALAKQVDAARDRQGRIEVEPDLSIAEHPNVFVVGDLAHVNQADGSPVPGVAPAATQMGGHVAKLIRDHVKRGVAADTARAPFRYRDKGSLATIGRARAVAAVGKRHYAGFFAWCMWLFIHLWFLVGFRNRFFVLLSWAFSYITFGRGARLITGAWQDPRVADPTAEPPMHGRDRS